MKKGLEILIYPDRQGVDINDPNDDLKKITPVEIDLNKLILNEPASKMNQSGFKENLKQLVQKIKKGLNINPIIIHKVGDKYQILDGHHRFFAYKILSKDKIKAIIVDPKFIKHKHKNKKI